MIFSSSPIKPQIAISVIRVLVGFFIAYHGLEVFDADKMKEYVKWDIFKDAYFMPYLGKGAEFAGGALLMVGLFTRLSCLIIIGTFTYITFFIGNGKFLMEDQHPFLFALLGVLFFLLGPGSFSLDALFVKNEKTEW
jgi:putative oxidoreductase